MLRLLILLLFGIKTYAQPNVWLSGHLIDGANEEVEITFQRSGFDKKRVLASTKADKNGDFKLYFTLEIAQSVKLNFLGSHFLLYLYPNDSLKITTSKQVFDVFMFKRNGIEYGQSYERSPPPIFEGKAAALNQFLYKYGLHGRDSLQEKPIVKHATAEMYANMIDDIASYTMTKYQRQFGLTDTVQAAYLQASLAGQGYFRKKRFASYQEQETEEEIPPIEPSFKIIQNDLAIRSENYNYALINYLKINQLNIDEDSLVQKYNRITKNIQNLPKTQELLLANLIFMNIFFNKSGKSYAEATVRFQQDFPNSDYIIQIKRTSWSHRLLQVGTQFPEIVFQNEAEQNIDITKFKGKPTAILFWNTWCDSCQIRLTEFAKLAESHKDSSFNFVAIAANNRVDSWQECIKNTFYTNLTHLYTNDDELGILRGAMADKNFPTNAHLLLIDSTGKITKLINLANSIDSVATEMRFLISK